MHPFRTHAYEVAPQRLSDKKVAPRGGAFSPDTDFAAALDEYFTKSNLKGQPTIDLVRPKPASDGLQSSHHLRELVIDYCFGTPQEAKSAAMKMAKRLSNAMDKRSEFTLLMLVAYQVGNQRQLVIWAFPKDEPFHFKTSGERARVKILKDAFSRSSSFKKGALFEGDNIDSSFWEAHVIDKQAENAFGSAADYWVRIFLDGRPSLTGKAGTRLLAKCLRVTHDELVNIADRHQITDAIVAVRTSQRRQWSLKRFANEYLSGVAKTAFLENCPPETRTPTFSFNKEEFESKLSLHVFRLEDNVTVAAPFGCVGQSVKITNGTKPKLTCEGIVVSEKVRSQRVG